MRQRRQQARVVYNQQVQDTRVPDAPLASPRSAHSTLPSSPPPPHPGGYDPPQAPGGKRECAGAWGSPEDQSIIAGKVRHRTVMPCSALRFVALTTDVHRLGTD